jgi:hypothetical protein
MSRVAHVLKSKKVIGAILAVFFVAGLGVGIYGYNKNVGNVHTVNNAQHQLTQISYSGKTGTNAFVLLKSHATVESKHYSFGDLVTSINGVAGNGPKYWTFYVNGKEASVGASAYVTKNGDTITWKLQ